MKFEITEVYSDGAVVKGSNGKEFGIGCMALKAVVAGLRNVANGEAPLKTGKVAFTNGRVHPLAQLSGGIDSKIGDAELFDAGTIEADNRQINMALILVEDGEETAVAYAPLDDSDKLFNTEDGYVATFSILRKDAGEVAEAIAALNHEGLPTQEEVYAARKEADAE